jgi:SpoIID/LytB domain protein
MRGALRFLALGGLLAAAGARAHEARQMLYSNQVAFGADGEPIVLVGLMDGQTTIRVRGATGLRVSLGGPAKTELALPPGSDLVATVLHSTPGQTRFRVALDGLAGADLGALAKARGAWQARGVEVEEVQLGGLVGYPGRLLDGRRTVLCERGRHATRPAAEARAKALARSLSLDETPGVLAEPVTEPTGRIVARIEPSGVEIQADDLLRLQPLGDAVLEVGQVVSERGTAQEKAEDRPYRGDILIAVDPEGRLAAVNRIPAEALLWGLVPAETYPNAPAAALEAQAITARGKLLSKLGVRHRGDPYHICADQHCQVYAGAGREAPAPTRAVEATRGLMLLDQAERVVDAVYSASCGGHTEHNESAWGGSPLAALRGHPDGAAVPWPAGTAPNEDQVSRFLREPCEAACATATAAGRKAFRWVRRLDQTEIDARVAKRHRIGSLRGIEVLERGVSGRALRVALGGESGHVEVRGELAIRRLFGDLPSSLFVVAETSEGWTFVGGGHGHGVGMCQHGAIGMARAGRSAAEILQHYYPTARVERVY